MADFSQVLRIRGSNRTVQTDIGSNRTVRDRSRSAHFSSPERLAGNRPQRNEEFTFAQLSPRKKCFVVSSYFVIIIAIVTGLVLVFKYIVPLGFDDDHSHYTVPCAIAVDLRDAAMADPYDSRHNQTAWAFQNEHDSKSWLRDELYTSNYGRRRGNAAEQNFTRKVDQIFKETFGHAPKPLNPVASLLHRALGTDADPSMPSRNGREAAEAILSEMYEIASQPPPTKLVAAVEGALEESVQQGHSIDKEVKAFANWEWRPRHSTKKELEQTTQWLESQRQKMATLLLTEAHMECWLRGQAHFQDRREQWAHLVQRESEEILLRLETSPHPEKVLDRYVKRWMNIAQETMHNLKPSIDVEMKCRGEWVRKRLAHCMWTGAAPSLVMIAEGEHYANHYNHLIWEWYNANPINLEEAAAHRDCVKGSSMDEYFQYSRNRRNWGYTQPGQRKLFGLY